MLFTEIWKCKGKLFPTHQTTIPANHRRREGSAKSIGSYGAPNDSKTNGLALTDDYWRSLVIQFAASQEFSHALSGKLLHHYEKYCANCMDLVPYEPTTSACTQDPGCVEELIFPFFPSKIRLKYMKYLYQDVLSSTNFLNSLLCGVPDTKQTQIKDQMLLALNRESVEENKALEVPGQGAFFFVRRGALYVYKNSNFVSCLESGSVFEAIPSKNVFTVRYSNQIIPKASRHRSSIGRAFCNLFHMQINPPVLKSVDQNIHFSKNQKDYQEYPNTDIANDLEQHLKPPNASFSTNSSEKFTCLTNNEAFMTIPSRDSTPGNFGQSSRIPINESELANDSNGHEDDASTLTQKKSRRTLKSATLWIIHKWPPQTLHFGQDSERFGNKIAEVHSTERMAIDKIDFTCFDVVDPSSSGKHFKVRLGFSEHSGELLGCGNQNTILGASGGTELGVIYLDKLQELAHDYPRLKANLFKMGFNMCEEAHNKAQTMEDEQQLYRDLVSHMQKHAANSELLKGCKSGSLLAVNESIASGAMVNDVLEINSGATALHIASIFGHTDVVQVLLENEASLLAQDKEGRTALHLCGLVRKWSEQGAEAIVELLLPKNAKGTSSLKITDQWGNLPLHLAAGTGDVYFIKSLVKRIHTIGILDDLSQIRNSDGCTPREMCCSPIARQILKPKTHIAANCR